ncbi:MAG: heavy-metal-associated domain-containing protein [Acidobacteria bacterium]|nr:heavy-metal-associated domain-containing protein [Acidobacteriota bacterium]
MKHTGSLSVASPRPARIQLITLAVGHLRQRDHPDALDWALTRVAGVEMAAADRETARVWVFANGTVDPLELVEALAACGFGASILDHQLKALE